MRWIRITLLIVMYFIHPSIAAATAITLIALDLIALMVYFLKKG